MLIDHFVYLIFPELPGISKKRFQSIVCQILRILNIFFSFQNDEELLRKVGVIEV